MFKKFISVVFIMSIMMVFGAGAVSAADSKLVDANGDGIITEADLEAIQQSLELMEDAYRVADMVTLKQYLETETEAESKAEGIGKAICRFDFVNTVDDDTIDLFLGYVKEFAPKPSVVKDTNSIQIVWSDDFKVMGVTITEIDAPEALDIVLEFEDTEGRKWDVVRADEKVYLTGKPMLAPPVRVVDETTEPEEVQRIFDNYILHWVNVSADKYNQFYFSNENETDCVMVFIPVAVYKGSRPEYVSSIQFGEITYQLWLDEDANVFNTIVA